MNRTDRIVAALCLLFFALGVYQISLQGLQADELLFTGGYYEPHFTTYAGWLFGNRLPYMQMTYVGSLKTWLYVPIFAIFDPSPASIRIPAILAGCALLWLTYKLISETVSPRAGLIAAALLAADPTLVWTTRNDWGPVALQHLLTVGAALAFVRRRIGLGMFLVGLALWDKSISIWMLTGLALSAILLLRPQIRERLSRSTIKNAILCFALGAYPLIRYNVSRQARTVTENAHFGLEDFQGKLHQLVAGINGSALFGYLVREDFIGPRETLTLYLLLASVAILPFLFKRPGFRPALFCFLSAATAWAFMINTKSAGGATHHVVLLWPWIQCGIAIVLAELPLAVGAFTATAALAACLAVTSSYHAMLARTGTRVPWSDAIYNLHKRIQPETRKIITTDWGIRPALFVLSKGQTPIEEELDKITPTEDKLYIAHVDEYQQFTNANTKLEVPGWTHRVVETIKDAHNRDVYQLIQYTPVSP